MPATIKAPRKKKQRGGGRRGPPSKKNAAIIKRLIATARLGLPMSVVAPRCGISRETLSVWRSESAELDMAIEQAKMEAAEEAWLKIMAAGETGLPNAWQSIAWRLERSMPESFARPEIQLNQQFNSSQTTTNNVLVITAEVAEGLSRRVKAIDADIETSTKAFLARRERMSGTGQDLVREIETSLIPSGTITLPPGEKTFTWWSALSRGDGHRLIDSAAAEFIVRTICVDALGGARSANLKVSMDAGELTLHDVWSVIQELCGPAGWAALTRRGEP